eukprot:comp21517_c2_seq1/m.29899 comp21517_c2_seq1/g.29899  ORF comp21517_c2_seq1/g.29899 comp21517_c2_seq1/m.29899 type:complete len:308 (+) comp21517_c2_seq1:258-1181(+)
MCLPNYVSCRPGMIPGIITETNGLSVHPLMVVAHQTKYGLQPITHRSEICSLEQGVDELLVSHKVPLKPPKPHPHKLQSLQPADLHLQTQVRLSLVVPLPTHQQEWFLLCELHLVLDQHTYQLLKHCRGCLGRRSVGIERAVYNTRYVPLGGLFTLLLLLFLLLLFLLLPPLPLFFLLFLFFLFLLLLPLLLSLSERRQDGGGDLIERRSPIRSPICTLRSRISATAAAMALKHGPGAVHTRTQDWIGASFVADRRHLVAATARHTGPKQLEGIRVAGLAACLGFNGVLERAIRDSNGEGGSVGVGV